MADKKWQAKKNEKLEITNRLERNKILIMHLSVVSLAIIIFVFWLINMPNVWLGNQKKAQMDASLQELKASLNSFLNQSEEKVNKIEEEQKKQERQQLIKDSNNLIQNLIEETNKKNDYSIPTPIDNIDSDDGFNEASLIDSNKNINCPEWINCMPSIGEVRDCQIPVGCEDFTQIAY